MWRLGEFPGLLSSLPCGEVTLLKVDGPDVSLAWWETVGRLVEDSLTVGRRVDVVDVDGTAHEDLRTLVDRNEGSGLLGVIDDSDVRVSAWHRGLRPHDYTCNVPTLHNVEVGLRRTGGYGPSVLILDQFQRARPWRAEGDPTYPGSGSVPSALLDVERAGQIHGLARRRKDSPTVVVWSGARVRRPGAWNALLDDSRLVLTHRWDGGGEGTIWAYLREDLVEEATR
jgi:hypothetical protein